MPKEKTDRQMTIMIQPSLYQEFETQCEQEHRTVSEVVRELMSKYSKGWIQMPVGTGER
jgi:predicted CopG family antitoxin